MTILFVLTLVHQVCGVPRYLPTIVEIWKMAEDSYSRDLPVENRIVLFGNCTESKVVLAKHLLGSTDNPFCLLHDNATCKSLILLNTFNKINCIFLHLNWLLGKNMIPIFLYDRVTPIKYHVFSNDLLTFGLNQGIPLTLMSLLLKAL